MLTPRRRETRALGPVYRAMSWFLPDSDPAPLRRAAAVVGDRGHVLDAGDLDAGVLDRADGGLTARTRALHLDVDLAHALLHGPAGSRLGGRLRGEGGGLAGPLEADVAGR